MKAKNKPFYTTSSNWIGTGANGNKILYKAAKMDGNGVVLQFVIRSDKDISQARHKSYKLIVP